MDKYGEIGPNKTVILVKLQKILIISFVVVLAE